MQSAFPLSEVMIMSAIPENLPATIMFECPDCKDVTEHQILRARLGKGNVSGTFQCLACGRISSTTVRLPKDLPVKVLISEEDETAATSTVLKEDEIVEVGDEFDLDDNRHVCISYIERKDGSRHKSCPASEVKALWVKAYDVLHVKVSVNDNRRTYPMYLKAEPDDEFTVGMVLPFDQWDCLVHAIKTKSKLLRRGTAEARDIVRIYGKVRRKGGEPIDMDDGTIESEGLPTSFTDDAMDLNDQ